MTTRFIVPPCREELNELYRDDDIVVVSKPAGLLSVPGKPPNDRDSALGRLIKINPQTRVVHRLDMSTSGLMVFGLTADSHRHLSRLYIFSLGRMLQAISAAALLVIVPVLIDEAFDNNRVAAILSYVTAIGFVTPMGGPEFSTYITYHQRIWLALVVFRAVIIWGSRLSALFLSW